MDTVVTGKKKVNVIVIGEVGVGKSTLVGNLMYEFSDVSNKISLEDVEKEAEKLNENNSKYALFLSKLNAYRCVFVTDLCEVNILNGYYKGCSFMSQFLLNTSRADCAVLVISANSDDFEKGIHEKGETCRQILLSFHLGVSQLIVVVNKMDCTVPSYSETRFQDIKNEICIFIEKIGYNPATVSFLPISALHGDNVVKISTKMPWFNRWIMKQKNGNYSECLVDIFYSVVLPPPPNDSPLRIALMGAYKANGHKKCYAGRIVAGVLKPGMQIVSALTKFSTKVECIRVKGELVTEVLSPENFTMELENVSMPYYVGDILGEVGNCPPTLVSYFIAQIFVLDYPIKIHNGFSPVIDIYAIYVPCEFVEIQEKCDRRTGQVAEKHPVFISNGDVAMVKIALQRPLCVEIFRKYPPLGRFTVRYDTATLAVGVIKQLM